MDEIMGGNYDGASLPNFWDAAPLEYRPMTSLRDVDQGGDILPSYATARSGRTTPDRVKTMMRLIRNGTLARASAASEMDDDD